MGQKPGLLGRDGGQKELRTRGRHDEQRDTAQPQQGCPEQPDAGNGPAGKHLTHRQRNAGVDRYGPFPQHSSEAAGPRPEAVDQSRQKPAPAATLCQNTKGAANSPGTAAQTQRTARPVGGMMTAVRRSSCSVTYR